MKLKSKMSEKEFEAIQFTGRNFKEILQLMTFKYDYVHYKKDEQIVFEIDDDTGMMLLRGVIASRNWLGIIDGEPIIIGQYAFDELYEVVDKDEVCNP